MAAKDGWPGGGWEEPPAEGKVGANDDEASVRVGPVRRAVADLAGRIRL